MIPSGVNPTSNLVNGAENYPNSGSQSVSSSRQRSLDEIRQQIKQGTFSVNVERLASKVIQSGVLGK